MARPQHLYVFCYDISRDGVRERVAALVEDHLVRVQKSVFEGRLTRETANRLAERAQALLGPDDSLRVYCLTEPGRRLSLAFGGAPLPERNDFWLV